MNYSEKPSKRRKRKRRKLLLFLLLPILAACIVWIVARPLHPTSELTNIPVPDWVDVQLIRLDSASRRGVALKGVKDIVIHYVGNPGTTAQQNRDYFNGNKSNVSSHFIVGIDGEVIQCVPLGEKSSATNWRNDNTISIEVCHPNEDGKFTQVTYNSVVRLTAWLCDTFNLKTDHVIRHYDVTGKECPLYFVKHEDAWTQFKADVDVYIKNELNE